MRFVPANCLRVGMEIAQVLYGRNNEVYLTVGTKLTSSYINSIQKHKFAGVYINDDISRDIEVVNIISNDLRRETLEGLKKLLVLCETGKSQIALMYKTESLQSNIISIIDELLANKDMMVNMIDLKCFDIYTYAHSVNVAILSLVIGISMDFDRDTLVKLGLSAILHDIGKVFIPKEIINKPGQLTEDEYEQIKTHSAIGHEYARDKFMIPTTSYVGIRDHHERWDGSGYPSGKKDNSISLFGRIIAVADVYDALTSERPYRAAVSPSEAMEHILGNNAAMFDPQIVSIFSRKVAAYPIGTTVELSNGYTALVIENYESFNLRPKVRLICDSEGNDTQHLELDLHNDMSLLNVVITGIGKMGY